MTYDEGQAKDRRIKALEADLADKEAEVRALRAALDRRGSPNRTLGTAPIAAGVSTVAIAIILAGAYLITAPKRRPKLTDNPASEPPLPALVPGAPAEEPVGVPECDAYLRRMETCLAPKVPDKTTILNTIKQQRQSFRTAAQNPATRETIRKTCIDVNRALSDMCP